MSFLDDNKKITAFIPGTVREIFVQKGQAVKEGEILLILEAMKMRNRVKSPINGTVKNVFVHTDQNVAKSFVLVELE